MMTFIKKESQYTIAFQRVLLLRLLLTAFVEETSANETTFTLGMLKKILIDGFELA